MKESHLCNNHICQYIQSQQTHTLLTILLDVVTENIDRYYNRKLGWTRSLSGSFGEKKNPLSPARIRTQYQSSHTTLYEMFASYPIIPYPTAFPYGNGMVLHFYQQQESSTTKTVHKVINKGLKTYV